MRAQTRLLARPYREAAVSGVLDDFRVGSAVRHGDKGALGAADGTPRHLIIEIAMMGTGVL